MCSVFLVVQFTLKNSTKEFIFLVTLAEKKEDETEIDIVWKPSSTRYGLYFS